MPKVSVNIPCFNSSKFIAGTIQSVLAQTFQDFEIVIIDDGSEDATGDIVRSFKDSRIKYTYKKNEGLAKARNSGLASSGGEYIAFIDHDDLWLPTKLEKQIKIIEACPDVSLIYSNFYWLYANGAKKIVLKGEQPADDAFEKLLYNYPIGLLTAVIRKKTLSELGIGFDEKLALAEEYDVFMRIAYDRKIAYVDEPLAVYRFHPDRQSVILRDKLPDEFEYVINGLSRAHPDIKSRYPDAIGSMASKINFLRAKTALSAKNPRKARAILQDSKWVEHKFFLLYCVSYLPYKIAKALMDMSTQ